MEVRIPQPVSMDKKTDQELQRLAPFGVVTAIHNDDRYNDDVAWYEACSSKYAHSHLWSRSWIGGPYAASFYPCPDRTTAEQVRDALLARDQAAAAVRESRDRAFAAEMDFTDVDTIDMEEIFGAEGIERLFNRR